MTELEEKDVRVLIVEDDESLSTIINHKFKQLGIKAKLVHNGDDALKELQRKHYDLGLMDVGLPDTNGINVVKRARQMGMMMPMIIITNHIDKHHEISSYDSGANIFHRKPIDFDLLESQVIGLLKLHLPSDNIILGQLQLVGERRTLRVKSTEIELSFKEFQLVKLLMNNPDKVFNREQVIRYTFKGVYEPQPSSVDTLVSRLRKKIDAEDQEAVIATVHGMGFKLGDKYSG